MAYLARTSTSELLRTVRMNASSLIPDPKVDLRRFRLTATSPIGPKRGTGKGSFIDSIIAAVDGFYGVVLQRLRPWQPKAPQLPKEGTAVEAAGIDLTSTPDASLESDLPVATSETILTNSEPLGVEASAESNEIDVDPHSADIDNDDSQQDVVMVSWDDQLSQIAEEREQVADGAATM